MKNMLAIASLCLLSVAVAAGLALHRRVQVAPGLVQALGRQVDKIRRQIADERFEREPVFGVTVRCQRNSALDGDIDQRVDIDDLARGNGTAEFPVQH